MRNFEGRVLFLYELQRFERISMSVPLSIYQNFISKKHFQKLLHQKVHFNNFVFLLKNCFFKKCTFKIAASFF